MNDVVVRDKSAGSPSDNANMEMSNRQSNSIRYHTTG